MSWNPLVVLSSISAVGLVSLGPAPRTEDAAFELPARPRTERPALIVPGDPPPPSLPAPPAPRRPAPVALAREVSREPVRRRAVPRVRPLPSEETPRVEPVPSTRPTAPVAVPAGGSTAGRIDPGGEIDSYLVEVRAGCGYRIEAEAGRDALGGIALALLDPEGRELVRECRFRAAAIEWVATRTATFVVQVGGWPARDEATGGYRLSVEADRVGDVPRDAEVLLPDADPAEGAFEVAADEDWYRLDLTAGTRYRIETVNLSIGADTVIRLYDATGTRLVAESDDWRGRASRIEWRCSASGTWLLQVAPARGYGWPLGRFAIRVRGMDRTP